MSDADMPCPLCGVDCREVKEDDYGSMPRGIHWFGAEKFAPMCEHTPRARHPHVTERCRICGERFGALADGFWLFCDNIPEPWHYKCFVKSVTP